MCNVRVVSKRANGTRPKAGETVIDISRTSILGNPYPMHHESQRNDVILGYRKYLMDQYHAQTPVWQAVEALAKRVANGEHLALQCWCAPLACHGDIIRNAIVWLNDPRQSKE